MALGPELLVNGDFSTGDLSGWSSYLPSGVGSIEVVNNELSMNTSANDNISQAGLLEIGKTYQIQYNVISYTSGNLKVGTGSVPTDLGVNIVEVEATGTAFIVSAGDNGVGGVSVIDDVSCKEVLPTTTVEVEWIDSISAAATGNKIYRDDVEIADIANGVQIYQDTTAETGTEYKYEVQAHDGAGDETTQEVEGENMDYITTAGEVLPPVADNIFPIGDAASPGSEEANAVIANWLSYQFADIESDATTSYDGDYCIKISDINDTGASGYNLSFPVTDAATYALTFHYKSFKGATSTINQALHASTNCTIPASVTLTATDWTEVTSTITAIATGDARIRFYTATSAGGTDNVLWLDRISIVQN